MGSFAYTCCVSGLPIEAGDAVRYLLLTQNPYQDEHVCYSHGFWYPRTVPLKAVYNDYGSVEDVEEGPSRDVWMEAFHKDLVEKGVGDNQVHDVAIMKDSTFDQLLEAVWERRVYVTRMRAGAPRDSKGKKISPEEIEDWEERQPAYVPTIRRVKAALSSIEGVEYLVDKDNAPDYIRVRVGGYGEKPVGHYAKAQSVLADYATVLVAGGGNYSDAMEVRVFMAPGKDAQGHDRHLHLPNNTDGTWPVVQAMIREDVWQALLTRKLREWSKKVHTIESYRKDIAAFIKDAEDRKAKKAELEAKLKDDHKNGELLSEFFKISFPHDDRPDKYPGAWVLQKDPVPFTMGPAAHYALLRDSDRLTKEFLESAAEFAFVQAALMELRFVWQPGHSVGPQCGEWETHKWWATQIARICRTELKNRDRG